MGRWQQTRLGPHCFISLLVVTLLIHTLAVAQQPADTSQVPAAASRTRPYRRAEWFWSQRAYPQGYIPSGVRDEALRQLDQMIADEARTALRFSGARGLSLANGSAVPASGAVWSPMGPQPTSIVFNESPVSGRLTSIVVDPLTPTTIYLGAAMGGVWKSTDGGANWTPISDDQPSLAVGAIALDPDNNQSIWVGTGEGEFGGDNYYGAGILKSANGGATWTQLAQSTFGVPINSIPPTIGGAKIGSLAVLKGSGGQIAIAAVHYFQQSTSFTPHSGIYRTADGGATWTNPLPAASGNVVAWDPNNASNCGSACIGYATIGNPFGDSTNGFYRSADSGQTWTKMDGGGVVPSYPSSNVGRIAMGLAKNSTNNTIKTTIYLGIGNSSTMDLLGMYKSTDGGTTWAQLLNAPNYCPFQCFYDNVIGVVPNNDQVVFAGGAFGNSANPISRIWRSTDGGATWAEISKPTGFTFPALHADLHAITFSPDNSTIYAGTDGGIYTSANAPNSATASANITWTNLNGSATDVTRSLGITQFYPGMAITGANYVFGGTQDNGSQLFTGNVVWNEVACGDGGWSAIDPSNANTLYTACNSGPIDVEKSTTTPAWGSFGQSQSGINQNDRANFIPPLVMDPANAQILYFGSFKLYRTTNGAGSWTAMASGADLTGGGSAHINAIGVGPNNTVWVGTSDAKVQVSANANLGASATFTDRSAGLPTRAVAQVMPDFADSTGATAYVTYSGFDQFGAGGGDGLGYVYKTTNSGANWTNITGNLPHSPVNDIVVDPSIANTLYVATDVGVFTTSNGGTTWNTLVSGLPRSAVLSLKLHSASRTLVAGTHGRSVWRVIVGSLASVLPANLPFGQQGFGSISAPQAVTVSNTGSTAVTLTSFSISNNPTEFAVAVPAAAPRSHRIPACSNGISLAPGASCMISVAFAPSGTGARSGTLTINNSGAVPVLSVSLSGTGPAASAVSLLPNPVAFGNVILNSSFTIPVALSNSTASGILVGSFGLPAGYSQTNNCPATLNAGSGCTVSVTFHPTSLTTFSGTLTVSDNGPGNPHTAPVSGTGFSPTITPSRPARPVRSAANLVIAGRAALVPIVFTPGSATGTASLSCFGAPDGTTCDVQPAALALSGVPARANVLVRYTDSADAAPPGLYQVQVVARTGSFASILPIPIELASGSAASGMDALPRPPQPAPQRRSAPTATDSTPPVLRSSDEPAAPAFALSATRVEFGAEDRKPDAAAREITLTNLQSVPLTVSIDSITGDFVQSNDCGAELPVGANCRIAVRLKPSASAPSSGKLTINTAEGAAAVELVAKDR